MLRFVALALAVLCTGSVATPAPAAPIRWGVVNSSGGADPWEDEPDALARAAGARWIREEVAWSDVEPSPGRWDWAKTDRMELAAARHGLTVVQVLTSPPGWASTSLNALPFRPRGYATFAARAAARYGPRGSLWRAHPTVKARPATFELWNEPYTHHFSVGGIDPARYAVLARGAAAAGRRANPRARFLLAVDVGGQDDFDGWVGAMADAIPDMRALFAGVAVHPYGEGPPDARSQDPEVARWQTTRVERIHDELVARGLGALHLWVTEIGWPTCPESPKCVTEAQQGTYLRRFVGLVRGPWRAFIEAVFLYRLQEWAPQRPDDPEDWFGVVRPDRSHKPAWAVLQRAMRAGG